MENYMHKLPLRQRVCQIFLWLVPFMPFLGFAYHPGGLLLYSVAGVAQGFIIAVATWMLGAEAAKNRQTEKGSLFTAGALLVASWMFISLALKMDSPPKGDAWIATLSDQVFRYAALFVGGPIAFGGFKLLKRKLREAGEQKFSSLGFAIMSIATLLFLIFAIATPVLETQWYEQHPPDGTTPGWYSWLFAVSAAFKTLTYLATAFFMLALRKVEWVGKTSSKLMVGLCLLAALLVPIFPLLPSGFASVFFAVRVPAVAFIMPYLIGVNLVRRAGDVP